MKRLPSVVRTGVAATLLAAQLIACTSWHVVDPSPAAFTGQGPQRARVTLADSSRVTWNSTVMVDSRIGPAPNAAPGVPLSDVRQVEVRRISPVKTTLLIGLVSGMVVGLVLAGKAFHDAMSSIGEIGWN